MTLKTILAATIISCVHLSFSQSNSVAREWNNLILEAIRNDYARPTVHARNLFHHSVIAYDAWAAFDSSKKRYFLGDTLNGYVCAFDGIDYPADLKSARRKAISYASYRFIVNRYMNSPDYSQTFVLISNYMNQLGYDVSITSTDYVNGGPAELGNYLAEQIQLYGYTDGSNELNAYENVFYDQLNPPIVMDDPGNPNIQDPNHWQPITLIEAFDQSNNPILGTPEHLSPEWGEVHPFSLDSTMYNELSRDGDTYKVYFDTVMPAYLNPSDSASWNSFYKWNHTLVSIWQSHLDPADGVMWDISPASLGNNTWYPTDSTQYAAFYDLINGGDPGTGYALNPVTNTPYVPQVVPRGDYARVLAEFWADGLDSETPPGHWFEIYHYVSDQPTFERKWQGVGPVLDTLEYDVKAQLTLGGTMHDAAISAWSLKGYYDYIRPVSAIRHMADMGQSSDTSEMSYHTSGIPLLPGFVEVVQIGDTLAGQWNENVGKIKLYTWKGHAYIADPLINTAGVGWILAENWWPYQRPTFVTPPFAGFVSGHSTFSRAAANTMEFITGSPYFPGGLGEFVAIQNDYLKFEEGPSTTIKLQWASYKDAADQCSLSRLWGGIHPPIDDVPGRLIGEQIGAMAFSKADSIFQTEYAALVSASTTDSVLVFSEINGQFQMSFEFNTPMDTSIMPNITLLSPNLGTAIGLNQTAWIDSLNLEITFDIFVSSIELENTRIQLDNLVSGTGLQLPEYVFHDYFIVDTKKPLVSAISFNNAVVNDSLVGQLFSLEISFDEPCDTSLMPSINFSSPGWVNPTFVLAPSSIWLNDSIFKADYDVFDFNETVENILTEISVANDIYENEMDVSSTPNGFIIDTENPSIVTIVSSDTLISQSDLLSPQFTVNVSFNEAMNIVSIPTAEFWNQGMVFDSLQQNTIQTSWIDTSNLTIDFFVFPSSNNMTPLDFIMSNAFDVHGNSPVTSISDSLIWSDMKSPEIIAVTPNKTIISDSVVGSNSYYVDIEFDERMDMSVQPLVVHSAAQTVSNSIQYNFPISYFIDSTHYRAYFQIVDENIEVSTVDLNIQFGQDYAGNDQIMYDYPGFISLDTKNPSIVNVFANNYVLNGWGQTFEVFTVYDETMLADIHPTLTFSPVVPISFPKNDSLWSNGTNHSMIFSMQGSPLQITIFDIMLNGAVDLAGNLQNVLSLDEFFQINPVVGLNELSQEQVYIFPSIFNSGMQLSIVGVDLESDKNYTLMNAQGQVVRTVNFQNNQSKLTSEAIYLSAGMYFLNNGTYQFKIVVK